MRVICSRKDSSTGDRFHSCPKTQGIAHPDQCEECSAKVEVLKASYRVYCPYGEPVRAIEPSHVDDQIPESWGDDKFSLGNYSYVEPKLDGTRALMKISAAGNKLFGRRNNRFGDQSEFTDNVPHLRDLDWVSLYGTILDAELLPISVGTTSTGNLSTGSLGAAMSIVGADPETAIATQELIGQAHLFIFDVPVIKGKNITDRTWSYRQDILRGIWAGIPKRDKTYIHLMPAVRAEDKTLKMHLYKEYLDHGVEIDGYNLPAEGIVLVNPLASYYDLRAFLKKKQDVTLDAVVTSWIPGKKGTKYEHTIGALRVSVIDKFTGELREIAEVPPGTDKKRAELYALLGNLTVPQIKDHKIIVWLQAQSFTKFYRMRHPRIIEYCQDRDVPTTLDFTQVERR